MKASRRQALAGALVLPALGAMPKVAFGRAGGAVFVHDPSLGAGKRLAAVQSGEVLAIEGDPIRFARALFDRMPSLVMGVSRPADALLIEDVAREAGYRPVRSDSLDTVLANSQELDRGLVLGWALARG